MPCAAALPLALAAPVSRVAALVLSAWDRLWPAAWADEGVPLGDWPADCACERQCAVGGGG